jgi:outer membrane protein TolC
LRGGAKSLPGAEQPSHGARKRAGPSFQWNILNYGQITNNVRLQDATLQQLLIDYQNTVLAAQQQVWHLNFTPNAMREQ